MALPKIKRTEQSHDSGMQLTVLSHLFCTGVKPSPDHLHILFLFFCVSRAVVMNHRSGGKCAHDYSLVNK